MEENKTKMNCPVFLKQESAIRDLTGKITRIRDLAEKVALAEGLQKELATLLACPDYDGQRFDCQNCRFIANLRAKATDLIKKAKKLA